MLKTQRLLGGQSVVEPPVPIPNTEVKRLSADDTALATGCGKYATAKKPFLFGGLVAEESP